ncbi:MAG TPA: hypothetical protein VM581_04225 [Magnetospirillaceae bacterium]|nr:hypothetical protein [Magnetospirillaceae bacterium]
MAKKQDPELAALAAERGFEVHAGMTNRDIRSMLGPTPPTVDQVKYVELLAGQPVSLTSFGHAHKVISELEDLRNTMALEKLGWQEGDILAWRDGYYQIVTIYGSPAHHRFLLQIVDLESDGGVAHCIVRKAERPYQHNPHILLRENAKRVDLSTWPVTLEEHPEDERPV